MRVLIVQRAQLVGPTPSTRAAVMSRAPGLHAPAELVPRSPRDRGPRGQACPASRTRVPRKKRMGPSFGGEKRSVAFLMRRTVSSPGMLRNPTFRSTVRA